ncbi:MAG TPA: hypothetical protein DCQ33_00455 [Nitrospira sp.]|nr:hypothetical protein [Nitrospira sp.]
MLVQFSVKNYLSFYEPVTLSLLAVPELDTDEQKIENTFEATGDLRLVKSAAIYGANASGKSNLINALALLRYLVVSSFTKIEPGQPLLVVPFRLRRGSEEQPSELAIIWLDDVTRFRYQITVDKQRVLREVLVSAPAQADPDSVGKEQTLFERRGLEVQLGTAFPEGGALPKGGFQRENALFLSYAAQFEGPISKKVMAWFSNTLKPISGLEDTQVRPFTARRLVANQGAGEILDLARRADLGIAGIRAEQRRPNEPLEIITSKEVYDEYGKQVGLTDFLFSRESEGTQKFVSLAGPLLDVLKHGKVLIIDEFDARLHPTLTQAIVEIFHGPANSRNAQLVFATHDTNLLNRSLIRRDQIWFTEKNEQGATNLYSLADFQLEKSALFERDYLQGKFGAIPNVRALVADPGKVPPSRGQL